jgi:hypothetical protein
MKLPYLVIALLISLATLTSAQTTPTTLSKAKSVIANLKVELLGTQAELGDTKKHLEETSKNLDATNTLVLDLNTQIISLGKDRDTGWKTANDRLTMIEKLETKLGKVLYKVAIVATVVGFLFGIVAVLSVLRFLGASALLTGPYGFYAQAGAFLIAWGIGFGLVQYFFRT